MASASGGSAGPEAPTVDKDARGRNGTIKLAGHPLGGRRAHRPHLARNPNSGSLAFATGSNTAEVIVAAQAPSGSGIDKIPDGPPLHVKVDAQGTDGVIDTSQLYTHNPAGLFEQPNQGLHFTGSVSSTAGNAKHTVIWVQRCATPGHPDPTTAQQVRCRARFTDSALTRSGGGMTDGKRTEGKIVGLLASGRDRQDGRGPDRRDPGRRSPDTMRIPV